MVVWIDKLRNLVFREGHQSLSSAFTSFLVFSFDPKLLDCLELNLRLTIFRECVVYSDVRCHMGTKVDEGPDIM